MIRPAHAGLFVLLTFGLSGVVSCGEDAGTYPVPSWAGVAPEQVAEARKHGVPVAFENEWGMHFVLVPAGTFEMGSPEDENGRYEDETRHRVTISRPYYMQVTSVTNGEYRQFERKHDSADYEGHSLNGERQPVVEVSREDAARFAAWMTKQDGKRTYRLPTEAQWEYACRAGTTTRYSWGDSEAEGWRYANVNDPKTKEAFEFDWDGWQGWARDDSHRVTAPVKSYPHNAWGLYDLHGNVWEWCRDWYGEYPTQEVTDPTGPSSGIRHVLRGGSWVLSPRDARSANRDRYAPGRRRCHVGFRLISPLPSGRRDS